MNFEDKLYLESKLRTDMVLADKDTGKVISDKQRYIFLQLPYFNKSESECENLFDCVIYVLKKMEVLERMPFEKKNFMFAKLAEIAEVRKLNPEEQKAYDISLKRYRDSYAVMKTAMLEGRSQGLIEGRSQGLIEGRSQGLIDGRVEGERSKALEMARKLKQAGVDIAIIASTSELSAEEIEKL